jgi:hypothetical protein
LPLGDMAMSGDIFNVIYNLCSWWVGTANYYQVGRGPGLSWAHMYKATQRPVVTDVCYYPGFFFF